MMEAQSNYNIADLVYRPVFHHWISNCRNCQKVGF
jgi:hypothetical protein